MSKRWFAVLALLCILALALSVLWMLRPDEVLPPRPGPGYVLRDDRGRLALYKVDGSGPVAVYDVYTRLLPEPDVLALQKGIPVSDRAQLMRLLEDLGL